MIRAQTARRPCLRDAVPALLACLALLGSPGASANESALAAVGTLTIMPVAYPAAQTEADRAEALESLYGKLDDYIYKALLRKLALKGYVLDRPRRWQAPQDWSTERLRDLDGPGLTQLMPESAGHAAFLLVEDIDAGSTGLGSDASAIVSARIVERASARVIWSQRSTGEFSEHINLFYAPLVMLITPDKHAAVEQAFVELFAEFPEKPL